MITDKICIPRLVFCALLLLIYTPIRSASAQLMIDAVVAVVDGEPISISDLEESMSTTLPHDLNELKQNKEAMKALQELIETRVLENEARDRKISVDAADIDAYIAEVAKKNSLTPEEFESALKAEGLTLMSFRKRTRIEMIKSKLASSILNREVAVSEEEVEKALKKQEAASQSEKQVELAVIFISQDDKTEDELIEKLASIKEALQNNSAEFTEIAKKWSEAPEAAEGGVLPPLNPEDLSPVVRAEIERLSPGEVSNPIPSADGVRIFQLVSETSAKNMKAEAKKEIREKLRKEKVGETLQSFFMSDIYKKHSIEKKL